METEKLKREFEIPVPSLEKQEEIVTFLDEIYKTSKIEDTIKYLKDKPIFNLLIDKNYDGFKNIIFFQENIPKLIFELENIPKKKILQVQSIFKLYCNDAEIKKLGDIVELKRGKSLPKNKMINGVYPVIGGGAEFSGYHNEFNYDGINSIFIARVGSAGFVSKYKNKCYITDLTFALEPININVDFLYLYLKNYQSKIEDLCAHNAAPNLSWEKFKKFEIPVTTLEKQEEIVTKIEELEKETSHYNQYANMLQTELNNINEIISIMTIKSKNDSELINKLEELENIEENIDIISNNSNNQSEQSEENNNDQQIIEYKNKTYILENDKIYKINENGNKSEQYGNLINGKVKKIKSDKEISI
jgi:hypothetical protein